MANESEYDDIRTAKDFRYLALYLKGANFIAHMIRMDHRVPVEIRKAAFKVELEAQETLNFISSGPLVDLRQRTRLDHAREIEEAATAEPLR
jgi:hypothetical protein